MGNKYKLAVGIGLPSYIIYSGRYFKFSEVLTRDDICLTEVYASLAIF